jgi:hypothetical protein
MVYKDSITRTTFTVDRKYFFRTEAKWAKQPVGSARIVTHVEVFEGSPNIYGNEAIHVIDLIAEMPDLLDALQSAEAAARQYVASFKR